MDRVLGCDGDRQRLRVGVADVFRGEANQPPRDVERILAGLDHPRQPVDRSVRIAVAHRLVQRRNQVVVLFARLVVEERAPLDRLLRRARRRLGGVRPADGAAATLSSSRFSAARASPLA